MSSLENATIAIQKSGRLTQGSIAWLNEKANTDLPVCEDPFDKTREITDKATGITIAGFSNGDVLKAVVCGIVDFGIAGEDKVDELIYPDSGGIISGTSSLNQFANLTKLALLGGDQWRLSMAKRTEAVQMPPRRILTSYPNLTRGWLRRYQGLPVETIDRFSGGIESIARRNGYDTVCDIVHKGESIAANDFVETDVLGWYSPVLVQIERQPLAPELFDVLSSPSILDIMAARLEQRRKGPTGSEASMLVNDGNEARKKFSSENGEFIVEQVLRRDVELEAADVLYSLVAAMVEAGSNVRLAQVELGGRYNGENLLPLLPKQRNGRM